jgi:hypothetical protein
MNLRFIPLFLLGFLALVSSQATTNTKHNSTNHDSQGASPGHVPEATFQRVQQVVQFVIMARSLHQMVRGFDKKAVKYTVATGALLYAVPYAYDLWNPPHSLEWFYGGASRGYFSEHGQANGCIDEAAGATAAAAGC